MPRPFTFRDVAPSFSSGDALEERPDLAVLVAKVVAAWATLEMHSGVLFALLLRGREAAAMEVFNALVDRRLKEIALLAAAKTSDLMTPEMIEEAERLFTKMRKVARHRNAIAHGFWIAMAALPDSLLLADYKTIVKAITFRTDPVTGETRGAWFTRPMAVQEYRAKDFENVLSLIAVLTRRHGALLNAVANRVM